MKASDLRIGNFIHYIDSEGTYIENKVDWEDIKLFSDNPDSEFLANYKPINLRYENVLEAIGFEQDELTCIDATYQPLFPSCLTPFGFKIIHHSNGLDFYDDGRCIYHIEYLHQLQNYFFGLTGDELTVNKELLRMRMNIDGYYLVTIPEYDKQVNERMEGEKDLPW